MTQDEFVKAYTTMRDEIFPLSVESTPEELKDGLSTLSMVVEYQPLSMLYKEILPFYQVARYLINVMVDKLGVNEVSNQIHNLDAPLGCQEYFSYFVRQRLEHE